jgi:aspartate 1-decarboxylase
MERRVLSSSNCITELAEFLGVEDLPKDSLPQEGEVEAVFFHDHASLDHVLPETGDQRYLNRAALVMAGEREIALSTFSIDEEKCRGHFPGYPMAQLGILTLVMAQVGSIAALSDHVRAKLRDENGNRMLALVTLATDAKSGTCNVNGKKKMFLLPGDVVTIIAENVPGEGRVSSKRSNISVFIGVGRMVDLTVTYELMDFNLFTALYRRHLR